MTNVQKVRDAYETEAEAQRVLQALQKLLRLYEMQSEETDCPLCDMTGCTGTPICPWYVFTGDTCMSYREKRFLKSDGFNYTAVVGACNTDQKAWRTARMRQLPKWIFAYELAIESW